MTCWVVILAGLSLVFWAWFVTLTYYPPKGKTVPRASLSTYTASWTMADPNREKGPKRKGDRAVYEYVHKNVSFVRGIAGLAMLWGLCGRNTSAVCNLARMEKC